MPFEAQESFKDYYKYLEVPQDAPQSIVQQAFDTFVAKNQLRLNQPLTKDNALYIHNIIEPDIQQHLLSSSEARATYDQHLREAQRKELKRMELADNEGLDDALPQPFLFDPIDGFDTEAAAAFSLRQIAHKLDHEWAQACAWILDTADDTHVFIGFLTLVARRPRLAERVASIIAAVRKHERSANEGVEQCITLLDPHIERPTAVIHSQAFDGTIFDAGSFVSDLPATVTLVLDHAGMRGCVFGTVESRTDWVRFANEQTKVPFSLLPEGTEPTLGRAETSFLLGLQVRNLARGSEYVAHLVLRMENYEPPVEVPIIMRVFVEATPPRVVFVPIATAQYPIQMKTVRRGETVTAPVMAGNRGDEQFLPLTGRITSRDPGASAIPTRFHTNEMISLTVDTGKYPFGKPYDVTFFLDYGASPGTQGPQTLSVHGDILPTPWQSMVRQRGLDNRLIVGIVTGIIGYIVLDEGAWLASSARLLWIIFLALPMLLAVAIYVGAATTVTHRQRAGAIKARLAAMRPWLLLFWGISAALIVLLLGIFAITSHIFAFAILSGIVGALASLLIGFTLDTAQRVIRNQP